jgi:hypothetical protein
MALDSEIPEISIKTIKNMALVLELDIFGPHGK